MHVGEARFFRSQVAGRWLDGAGIDYESRPNTSSGNHWVEHS